METGIKPVLQVDQSRAMEMKKQKLRENCSEFESVMISYMFKSMRDSIDRSEDPDNARDTYEDMLNNAFSKQIAQTGRMGIGDMLYSKLETLLKAQGQPQTANGVETAPQDSPAAKRTCSVNEDGLKPDKQSAD